jgi:hypothetical protein
MPPNVIEACAVGVSAADFSLRAQGQGDPVAAPSIQKEAKVSLTHRAMPAPAPPLGHRSLLDERGALIRHRRPS